MQSDWYKTLKEGTYLVVPADTDLPSAALPEEVRGLLDGGPADRLATDVDSNQMVLSFDFLGIDDCLTLRGYCVLRT